MGCRENIPTSSFPYTQWLIVPVFGTPTCHPRNGAQSRIHMICDAIHMEEDYAVHTMILNLSDKDES